MKPINSVFTPAPMPISVLQFGEGNFLRGFADYMIDIANVKGITNMGVAVIKPRKGSLDSLRAQDCLYTVLLRGRQNGIITDERHVVKSVQTALGTYEDYDAFMAVAKQDSLKIIISNTTEAGIALDENDSFDSCPPETFPGKLAKFLFARWQAFAGSGKGGLIVLPAELIENGGDVLCEYVLKLAEIWELPAEFVQWVKENIIFCNTLVDRIVTGFPQGEAAKLWEELGYRDDLMVSGEPFGLWVIESKRIEDVKKAFPLDKAGMPVIFTENLLPYRERKVKILNGAHTGTSMAAYLAGCDTVGEFMADGIIRTFMLEMLKSEIAPTVKMPQEDTEAFINAVLERFENPFIRHELLSIALNSVSKWKARVLPSLMDLYTANGITPPFMAFSFAALLAFYTGIMEESGFCGKRDGEAYPIRDDLPVTEFFASVCGENADEYVKVVAANTKLWGCDLNTINGFTEMAAKNLSNIRLLGMQKAIEEFLKQQSM